MIIVMVILLQHTKRIQQQRLLEIAIRDTITTLYRNTIHTTDQLTMLTIMILITTQTLEDHVYLSDVMIHMHLKQIDIQMIMENNIITGQFMITTKVIITGDIKSLYYC